MKENIEKYFNAFNFDIRKSNKPRSFDQKVTPDVLTIIADCVIEFTEQTGKEEFTIKDIWEFEYSNSSILDIFNKPKTSNVSAKSEYNKFFGQPLLALAYSQILSGTKTNSWKFKINNRKILEFIATRERNSLLFLQIYLEKILKFSDKDILLIIDDADKLFKYRDISNDFFALIRAWNQKGQGRNKIWKKLKIVSCKIAY
jgi:hypothetical protein